jgi:hypothetical protein
VEQAEEDAVRDILSTIVEFVEVIDAQLYGLIAGEVEVVEETNQ